MGAGGSATVLGAATPAFSCTPTQVTALNWPALEPLGALRVGCAGLCVCALARVRVASR
jgi:hypothetical protein